MAEAPPPQIDEVPALGASAPADAALILANEDYLVLPDVPYAARDAALARDTLVRGRGVPADHVVERIGANREQMLAGIEEAVGRVGDGGTLWIYFAGHGAASPSTGELLLVGDDAKQDPTVFAQRSVAVAELRARAEGRVVFVLDTCYAGFGRAGEELVPGTRFAVPAYASGAADTVMWTAAGPDEISGPYGAARHGLFTYFAMGALRGWADGVGDVKDDRVTLAEAHRYVSDALKVLQVTAQHPALSGPADLGVVEGRLERGPELAELSRPAALVSTVASAAPRIPERAAAYAWPITRRSGATYVDAYNVELGFRGDLIEVARYDADGGRAVRRFNATGLAPAAAVPLALVGGYSSYLFGWDLVTGHNLRPEVSGSVAAASIALTAGVVGWEVGAQVRRRKARGAIEEAANRVVRGEGR